MKALVIDGNSILNRSYYGVRPLNTKAGFPTNAIFGFLSVFNKMMNEESPDFVAAAFDLKGPTFRHEKYEAYKANRKGMPDDLAAQLPVVKEVLAMLGVSVLEIEGYEADDILGTFARICREQKVQCVLATGDRDSLQLVGDGVTVRLATNKEAVIYDTLRVLDEYGVLPKELIEVKALMGDSSDNIPGVKGIGEKTALALISEYKSIDKVFEAGEDLDAKPRAKTLLLADGAKEMAELSRELGTVCCQVPGIGSLEKYKRKDIRTDELYRKLDELEMRAMIERFGLKESGSLSSDEPENETEPVNILRGLSFEEAKAKLGSLENIDFLYEDNRLLVSLYDAVLVYEEDCEAAFDALVLSSDKPKRTADVKALYRRLASSGKEISNVCFDITLAAYLLDASAKSYAAYELLKQYLPGVTIETEEGFFDIAVLSRLCDSMHDQIVQKGMERLLCDIELPLSLVLADMEEAGFAVDGEGIKDFGSTLKAEIERLTGEIYELAGEEFNINSTKELGAILFDKLSLPFGKKTKTGYSTGAEVLEGLEGKHPIAAKILEYRRLSKLNSTYVDGLLKVIGGDGRIHSVFKQTETRTGRISSAEPNMQNIPVRTPLGSQMRRFFVARDGYLLVDADYSQIELRVLAHIANDRNMIEAFKEGADIHTITASEVFGVPPALMPPELRNRAKAINFGIVYGIGPYSLSKGINVSVSEAKKYIERYLETYSGVSKYMKDIVKSSEENGYVSTMFGRRRDLPEIKSKNHNLRAFGERVALNTPIQGTAADIIKIAMIRVHNRLKEEKLDARLILQVHDELLVEAREQDREKVMELLKEEMEHAADLSVKLLVDVSAGKTWYDAKG